MKLSAEGLNPREISDEIKKIYKITVSRIGIDKHIKKQIAQRKEIAKDVAAQYVEQSIPTDLEYLGNAILQLHNLAENTTLKPQVRINAYNAVVKATETRLRISGVGQQENEFTIRWDMGNDDEDELEVIEEQNAIDVDFTDAGDDE